MRSSHILLLGILGYALLSSVTCNNGNGPYECCFSLYPRRVNKNRIDTYYVTDQRCSKAGVILVTKKLRHICVDPSLSWVVSIMKRLDESSF